MPVVHEQEPKHAKLAWQPLSLTALCMALYCAVLACAVPDPELSMLHGVVVVTMQEYKQAGRQMSREGDCYTIFVQS